MRKKQRNKRRGRSKGSRRSGQHLNVVLPLVGDPVADERCGCPICAELAEAGQPVVSVDKNGWLVQTVMEPQPMMEVTVRGHVSTWPEISAEPYAVRVPVGCIVGDLVEYLGYKDPTLWNVFESLGARVGGEQAEYARVLRPGDQLVVSGVRTRASLVARA